MKIELINNVVDCIERLIRAFVRNFGAELVMRKLKMKEMKNILV